MTDDSHEAITWVVIEDGETIHEADTKAGAQEWVDANGVDPDRIASKARMRKPLYL